MVTILLLVLAAVLLLLEAVRVTTPWVGLGWLGLFCWVLSLILGSSGLV